MNIYSVTLEYTSKEKVFTFNFEIRTNDYDAQDIAFAYLKQTLDIDKLNLYTANYKQTGYDLDHIDKGITQFHFLSSSGETTQPIVDSVELLSSTEVRNYFEYKLNPPAIPLSERDPWNL